MSSSHHTTYYYYTTQIHQRKTSCCSQRCVREGTVQSRVQIHCEYSEQYVVFIITLLSHVLTRISICISHLYHKKIARAATWCWSAKRENFIITLLSHVLTRISICIFHLYHKKIARAATLKCTLKYCVYLTRASRSNTGTGFLSQASRMDSRARPFEQW